MNKKELKYFSDLIIKKKEEVRKNLDYLKNVVLDSTTKEASGDHSSYSFHMADQGTDAMERELAFMFASKSGRLVYHIEEALRRVKDGTYGKCLSCGRQINKARLDAVPHARLCIECKSSEEEKRSGPQKR